MNIPGERIIPMHGKNHRQVCQFGDETSSDYISVLELIRGWTAGAKEDRNRLNEEDMGEKFQALFDFSDANKNKPVLGHYHFLRWTHDEDK